jgi:hypothetical protein
MMQCRLGLAIDFLRQQITIYGGYIYSKNGNDINVPTISTGQHKNSPPPKIKHDSKGNQKWNNKVKAIELKARKSHSCYYCSCPIKSLFVFEY